MTATLMPAPERRCSRCGVRALSCETCEWMSRRKCCRTVVASRHMPGRSEAVQQLGTAVLFRDQGVRGTPWLICAGVVFSAPGRAAHVRHLDARKRLGGWVSRAR
jgi:hypothetical protein